MKLFSVDILASEGAIYSGDAESLVAPAEFGYMGVLANHAPLVARLSRGRIVVREASGKTRIFNSEGGGFLEVLKNRVTLLLSHKEELRGAPPA